MAVRFFQRVKAALVAPGSAHPGSLLMVSASTFLLIGSLDFVAPLPAFAPLIGVGVGVLGCVGNPAEQD